MNDVRLGGHHRRGMIHGKAFAITLAAGVILTLAVSASAHGDQWPDSPPPQSVAALQTTVDSQARTIRSRTLTRNLRAALNDANVVARRVCLPPVAAVVTED